MSLRVKRPLELDYTMVLLRALPPCKTLRYVRHVPLSIFYWRDSKMAFFFFSEIMLENFGCGLYTSAAYTQVFTILVFESHYI